MAEAHDITIVTALLGARRSLEPRIITEALDKIGRVGKGVSSIDEGCIHHSGHSAGRVSRLPTSVVNDALTIFIKSDRWPDPIDRNQRLEETISGMDFPS